MLPLDLSPRSDDDVDAYVRSVEPNQVQLVGHRIYRRPNHSTQACQSSLNFFSLRRDTVHLRQILAPVRANSSLRLFRSHCSRANLSM
jgi:hypothetical protein